MAYINIYKKNLYYNFDIIKKKTGDLNKIAIVLKDNAYGHGLSTISKLAYDYGIKHAVVKNIKEAKEIGHFYETVLILNDTIIKNEKYSFALNSLDDIHLAQSGSRVELKVDTGMHRNGISFYELQEALEQIKLNELELIGVMTHFRSADVLSSEFFWQKKKFEQVKESVIKFGYKNIRFHSHNSASILRVNSFDEDLVRLGIGSYGYNELPDIFDKLVLKPVLSLHARKISTRKLNFGKHIGYGGDFQTKKEIYVSTYDIGYGDGWMRGEYKKDPYVIIEGIPILGRVSMDFISLESQKDEVCIFNNAQDVAKKLDTISYEIITMLNSNIDKIVV